MGKYVMERLFKVFNIAGMAFIFVGGIPDIYPAKICCISYFFL